MFPIVLCIHRFVHFLRVVKFDETVLESEFECVVHDSGCFFYRFRVVHDTMEENFADYAWWAGNFDLIPKPFRDNNRRGVKLHYFFFTR